MFDIGFSELFVIAIVALLVLGPERLPKAARLAGLWLRRARAQWYSVKSELENELADDELKRSLRQARDQLQGEMQQLRDGLQHGARTVAAEFTMPDAALPPAPTTAPASTGDGRATDGPAAPGEAAGAEGADAATVARAPGDARPDEDRHERR